MKIAELYYFPFDIDPAFPLVTAQLANSYTEIDVSVISKYDEIALDQILFKTKMFCPHKYQDIGARMIMELVGQKVPVLVDVNGTIKNGHKEYNMGPRSFPILYKTMEGLRLKTAELREQKRTKLTSLEGR